MAIHDLSAFFFVYKKLLRDFWNEFFMTFLKVINRTRITFTFSKQGTSSELLWGFRELITCTLIFYKKVLIRKIVLLFSQNFQNISESFSTFSQNLRKFIWNILSKYQKKIKIVGISRLLRKSSEISSTTICLKFWESLVLGP